MGLGCDAQPRAACAAAEDAAAARRSA